MAAAIPHLRALAENDPRDADSWIRLAMVLRQAGDSKAEVDAWEFVLSIREHEAARARLAKLLPLLGREAEALPHLRLLAEALKNPELWRQLAAMCQKIGETDAEMDAWRHVLTFGSDEQARRRQLRCSTVW